MNDKQPDQERRDAEEQANDSGLPGGGVGRREEVRGSGVYPMSEAHPEGLPRRTQAEWGQGDEGDASDVGSSEARWVPPSGEPGNPTIEQDKQSKA